MRNLHKLNFDDKLMLAKFAIGYVYKNCFQSIENTSKIDNYRVDNDIIVKKTYFNSLYGDIYIVHVNFEFK